MNSLTVFSNTYTTTGANSSVYGNVLSGGVSTTGENAVVTGNIVSVGAATVGANSTVFGNLTSTSGPITILAGGNVVGTQETGGERTSVSSESTQVTNAQTFLSGLGSGTTLAAEPSSMTLAPGVYSAASLSMIAGSTFTLDGQYQEDPFWVFNIKDILAPGANTVVSLINAGDDASVFWNVSEGYASIGANSTFIGTILADDYISVGAGTTASGLGSSCGGIFSATSYVSTGDGASIGGIGCSGVNVTSAVPEPQMFGLMLTGLGVLGFVTRRRAQAKRA